MSLDLSAKLQWTRSHQNRKCKESWRLILIAVPVSNLRISWLSPLVLEGLRCQRSRYHLLLFCAGSGLSSEINQLLRSLARFRIAFFRNDDLETTIDKTQTSLQIIRFTIMNLNVNIVIVNLN